MRYAGFHAGLWGWFQKLQALNPDAHISDAGRGKLDQERYFYLGKSKAHYGQSAHNYNCALDIFRLTQNGADWNLDWFEHVVGYAVRKWNLQEHPGFKITWYGEKGAPFYELPHCEVTNWKALHFPLVEKL